MGDLKIAEGSAPTTPVEDLAVPVIAIDSTSQVGLYPVRYAISRALPNIPKVDGTLLKVTDTDGKAFPLGKQAHYTVRRLRTGYLYVFDETDNGWRIFRVNAEGPLLTLIDTLNVPRNTVPRSADASAQSPGRWVELDPLQQPTSEGILRVPSDHVLWLALSDAKWTRQTLQNHQDPAIRETHMRRFDAARWKGAEHHAPLSEVGQRVADHVGALEKGSLKPRVEAEAFGFSADPFRQIGQESVLQGQDPEACALLALEDPAGIAMDLARLMSWHYLRWAAQDDPNYVHLQKDPAREAPKPVADPSKRPYGPYSSPSQEQQLSAYTLAQQSNSRGKPGSSTYAAAQQAHSKADPAKTVRTGPAKRSFHWTMASSHAVQSLRSMEIARAEAAIWNKHRTWSGIPKAESHASAQERLNAAKLWEIYLGRTITQKSVGDRDSWLKIVEHKVKSNLGKETDPKSLGVITQGDEVAWELAEARKKAIKDWNDNHLADYNLGGYDTWGKKLGDALGKLDTDYIKDLALAHVAWCESQRFVAYFTHVFDRTYQGNDVGVGVAYTETLARCYEGVQDKLHCFDHILKWLESPLAENNLIVPALVANHGGTLEALEKAQGQFSKPDEIKWHELGATFQGAYGTAEGWAESAALGAAKASQAAEVPKSTETAGPPKPLRAKPPTAHQIAVEQAIARYMAVISEPIAKSLRNISETGVMTSGPVTCAVACKMSLFVFGYESKLMPVMSPDPVRAILSRAGGTRKSLQDPVGSLKIAPPSVAPKPVVRPKVQMLLGMQCEIAQTKMQMLPSGEIQVKTLNQQYAIPAGEAAILISESLDVESKAPGEIVLPKRTAAAGATPLGERALTRSAGQEAVLPAAAKSSTPFIGEGSGRLTICSSLFGGIMASIARVRATEEGLKAEAGFDKEDLEKRKWAYMGLEITAYMEGMGKVLDRIQPIRLWASRGTQVCGVLGVAGGFYLAYRDYLKAGEADKKGDKSLAQAYFLTATVSGLISVVALTALVPSLLKTASAAFVYFGRKEIFKSGITIGIRLGAMATGMAECALFAWIPYIGWALAVGGILVGVHVADKEHQARVANWLRNCCWGLIGRFESMKVENDEFQAALT